MKKGTKLYSILNFKCPECHEGDFFVSHPYNLKHIGDVHERCSECGCKYSKEPGFYYGAMYVSYALGVALFVAVFVAIRVLFPNASIDVYIYAILGSLLVLAPLMYHQSKIIWANMFMSYKGTPKEIQNENA